MTINQEPSILHASLPTREAAEVRQLGETLRVLYIDHIAQLSGGEIALVRLLEALRGADIEAHVILGEDGPLTEQFEQAGAVVEILPLQSSVRNLRKDSITSPLSGLRQMVAVLLYARRLRRRILELNVDIVHSNSLKSGIYGGLAARLTGVPLVWHLRDRLSPDYLPRFAILLIRLAIALLAKRAVGNSQSTLDTLIKPPFHSLDSRATAVSSPLRDVFDSSKIVPRAISGAGAKGLQFVMVGRLAEWKGQHVVIEAFSEAALDDSTLTIIGSAMFGENDYEKMLKSTASRSAASSRIAFLGFKPNVAQLLPQYDVLLHASITPEPFGQVIIEGLASGLVVIASDAGGPAEIITNGVDGILYQPGHADGLAAAMETVFGDPERRASLRDAGLRRALDYAPSVIATQMLDVYRSCFR